MRFSIVLFCVLILVGGRISYSQEKDIDYHAMAESNHVFQLRDAVVHSEAPLFYRATVEDSANRTDQARNDLNEVIRTAPHSKEVYEAHALLANHYFMRGLYRRALLEIQSLAAEKPDSQEIRNSISTDLNPPFAAAFPDLMKTGQKHSDNITGVGGSNSYDSILLPSATLQIGGYDVTLKPAHVFTTHGLGWSAGNLGIDLLNQGHSITLDFHAMTLELR
jgi:tetratricopeptide (TPR) repeat protein